MGEACRALGTPVTGGNVSLYNESPTGAVYPTPVIGMVGLIEDISHITRATFQRDGDAILLLGEMGGELGGERVSRHDSRSRARSTAPLRSRSRAACHRRTARRDSHRSRELRPRLQRRRARRRARRVLHRKSRGPDGRRDRSLRLGRPSRPRDSFRRERRDGSCCRARPRRGFSPSRRPARCSVRGDWKSPQPRGHARHQARAEIVSELDRKPQPRVPRRRFRASCRERPSTRRSTSWLPWRRTRMCGIFGILRS